MRSLRVTSSKECAQPIRAMGKVGCGLAVSGSWAAGVCLSFSVLAGGRRIT